MFEPTTEEIVEQAVEERIYVDMGKNLQIEFKKRYDDLLWSAMMAEGTLGGGLGGYVASNGAAADDNPTITLESLQRAYKSFERPREGLYRFRRREDGNYGFEVIEPPRYFLAADYAPGADISAIQVVAAPSMPPNEIRYVYQDVMLYRQPDGIIEYPRRDRVENFDIFEDNPRLGVPAIPNEVIQAEYQYQYQFRNMFNVYGFCAEPETPEQKIAREERDVKKKAAERKAEQLMFSVLKPSQVRQYQDHGWFECQCDDRVYRIRKGHSGNILVMKNGRVIEQLCVHPENAYQTPEVDTMLAQALMLMTDEKKLLQTANHTKFY